VCLSELKESGVSRFVLCETCVTETSFGGHGNDVPLFERGSHSLNVTLIDDFSRARKNFAHKCSIIRRFKNRELSGFGLDVLGDYATLNASCEAFGVKSETTVCAGRGNQLTSAG
jgi:hypothetical protein